ncbi:peptidoglycan synthetase FtsI [Nitrospirillum viridazoti Y2]|uniref:Cell division protein FtsI (Penicillin-binding protein 3) n=1 Tax=Nitrospirillum amazonense TaxID=28077 RepID=A0A560HT21_9PROT|nr:penicillin-binding protein 2 [Nitrospirillum amazonense]EGY00535.1 peptidoglycan synthetase FtsI [Nitrospirillum amazonense Y2]TWB48679.1 cell division protein FtsI (penicillin-binding protein 3) [Nitrospirillum amazonense]
MSDAPFSLTGFDIAGMERIQAPRSEGRVRLNNPTSHALEQGRSRLLVTAALFALVLGAIGVRLADTMVFSREAEPPVAENTTARPLPVTRAEITDRNGVLLATSLATASAYADPKLVIDAEEAARKLVATLPDLDYRQVLKDLKGDKRFVWIKRNLTPRQEFEVNKLGIPGVFFQQEEHRIYPQGSLTAHLIGLTGIDNNGLMGIEQSFDKRLREQSEPLRLSVDVRLQHIVRKEITQAMQDFNAIGGAGLIMDIKTGEILSMVSLPDFDPQNPGEMHDESKFNRATLGVYEMGSVFKILNTAIALETGTVKLHETFDTSHPLKIGRFTIHDDEPVNYWMDVVDIFRKSSNIGSAKMAEKFGIDVQREYMGRFGMLKAPSLEIPEVGGPLVPNPWRPTTLLTVAFGHGISVSPIQMSSAVAAVVDGGIMRPATLLKRDPNAEIPETRVISPQTSAILRKLMRLVVTEGTGKTAFGTGELKAADTLDYLVGGKTGTAEKVSGKGYAHKSLRTSFAGAFPMNDPRYVVFVMVDEPHGNKKSFGFATAGWVAAPAVQRIVWQAAPLLGVKPVVRNDPEILQAMTIN